jgi:hypothetical protein
MAFKTFTPGVLTASDVNTFMMRQAVIVCTSTTRPGSPNEGMTIYETNTKAVAIYNGTAWQYRGRYTSFTPTIAATSTGWALGNGTATGAFTRIDNVVIGRLRLVFGSTSTYGAADLLINLPVNGANTFEQSIGIGVAADDSAGIGAMILVNRSAQTFRPNAQAATGNYALNTGITSTIPFTWAVSDSIGFSFMYETS